MLPFWHALRTRPAAQAAMRGTNAAVVGMLGAALYNPVWTNAVQTQQDFALAGAASFYSPSGSCRPGSWSRCWPPPARFLVLCETSATTLGMGNATAPMMRSPFRKANTSNGSRQSTGSTSMPKRIVDRRVAATGALLGICYPC
jgi:hypothetical protein